MEDKQSCIKALRVIPGVGKSIAEDLWNIGITKVPDLKGRDPQQLFDESNAFAGVVQDRCLLYVFREAVYFASNKVHDPALLKWWNWKDDVPKTKSKRHEKKM